MYLLDASALITGERDAYRLHRFRIFWQWLEFMGTIGRVKVPAEQYKEIVGGNGDLVDWLKAPARRKALLLDEIATIANVRSVVNRGYSEDLNATELAQINGDVFLISHALVAPANRTIVTFEVSKPGKTRANRKVPDVCAALGIASCTLYQMVDALDFTTEWEPSSSLSAPN